MLPSSPDRLLVTKGPVALGCDDSDEVNEIEMMSIKHAQVAKLYVHDCACTSHLLPPLLTTCLQARRFS